MVRGASLVPPDTQTATALLLAPDSTVADINLIDTDGTGAFEAERFQPDDSGLASYPNLAPSISRAKEVIIQLAFP